MGNSGRAHAPLGQNPGRAPPIVVLQPTPTYTPHSWPRGWTLNPAASPHREQHPWPDQRVPIEEGEIEPCHVAPSILMLHLPKPHSPGTWCLALGLGTRTAHRHPRPAPPPQEGAATRRVPRTRCLCALVPSPRRHPPGPSQSSPPTTGFKPTQASQGVRGCHGQKRVAVPYLGFQSPGRGVGSAPRPGRRPMTARAFGSLWPSGSPGWEPATLPLQAPPRPLPHPSALMSRCRRSQWPSRASARPLRLHGSNLKARDFPSSVWGPPGGPGLGSTLFLRSGREP